MRNEITKYDSYFQGKKLPRAIVGRNYIQTLRIAKKLYADTSMVVTLTVFVL